MGTGLDRRFGQIAVPRVIIVARRTVRFMSSGKAFVSG